jgi:hypothetical protein
MDNLDEFLQIKDTFRDINWWKILVLELS